MKTLPGVRPLARGMHVLAAAALTAMMLLTVADVVLRSFRRPIVGTYELVGFLGAVAIGFSMPQTSLDKGQVVMDLLTGRLPGLAHRALAVLSRLLGAVLFGVLAWSMAAMGGDLRRTGDETPLLHLPLFLLAWGMALAFAAECLVLLGGLRGEEKA